MDYVLDPCIGFKWLVDEEHSDIARLVREDFRRGVHALVAPDVFPIEVAHALTRAERQSRLTPPEGGVLWTELMTTCPALFSSLPLLPHAYQIASAARIGIYDCLYVALAEQQECEFLTADERLFRTLSADYPFIALLAHLR